MATTQLPVSRYRLPSEDDDVFPVASSPTQFQPGCTRSSVSSIGNRGLKRSRLSTEDDDDVFFRPRARLDSAYTPHFPRPRLPSDSDTSCSAFFSYRVGRPREKRRPVLLPPRHPSSSSVQLNSSQYTADDSPDPAFKTPALRPRSRRPRSSTDGSSLLPNSSGSQFLPEPPRITRAPVGWSSPLISPLPDYSAADFRFRLQHEISSRSSVSDWCFSPPEQTSTPASSFPVKQTAIREPITSSPVMQTSTPTDTSMPSSRQEVQENLARSILSEELRPDSGISSLPSFDADQACFSKYRDTFEEKLLDVMVNILNTVEPLPDLPTVTCYQVHPQSSEITLPSLTAFTKPEEPELVNQTNTSLLDELCYLDFSSSYAVFAAPTPAPSSASEDSQTSLSPAFIAPSPLDLPRLSPSLPEDSVSPAHTVPARTPTSRSAQCSVCHKILASTNNLKAHMRVHTGERPFVCPVCSKTFNDGTSLRRHKLIHARKPFMCRLCSTYYVTERKLIEHELKRHGRTEQW